MESEKKRLSLDAPCTLIKIQSSQAMRHLMFNDPYNYNNEINELAKNCANLLTTYNEDLDSVVEQMEVSMTSHYLQTLKELAQEIQHCQEKKAKLSIHAFYGEKEARDLSERVRILENFKNESPRQLMEIIVTAVLEKAQRTHNVALKH
jgi:hypothetical protein